MSTGAKRRGSPSEGRLVFNVFDLRVDIIEAHRGPMGQSLEQVGEIEHPWRKLRGPGRQRW